MNETDLSQRLGALVVDQPTMRHTSADDLRAGKRRLRVRSAAAVAGTGLLAAAAAGALPALWPGGTDDQAQVAGAVQPLSDDEIVQRCAEVDGGPLDPAVFGPGSTLKTSDASAGGDVGAVIVSPDGRTWGACQLFADVDPEPFEPVGPRAGYPMQPPESTRFGRETNGWEIDDSLRYIDRFPAEVTRVELDFGNGLVLSSPAVDGFVVFQREDPRIHDGEPTDTDRPLLGYPKLTLYGADGRVLADETMAPGDGSLPREYYTLVPGPS